MLLMMKVSCGYFPTPDMLCSISLLAWYLGLVSINFVIFSSILVI